MSYVPSYTSRINWENEPSTVTPINETNLNKMDYALYQHDQALQGQDSRISTLEGESKVTSFKGRTGAVTPANDDYTIAQIKATGTAGQVPTLNSQGKLEMADVPESGHEIVNPSGTPMTQRSKLKFMGSVSVSDDSANDQTVINMTGGGGGGSGHTIQNPSGSSMTQRTNLQFTGTGVTVTDNSADDKTVVNIDSSGHTIKDGDGTAMSTQPNLQFADANVSNDGTNNATVVRNFVDIDWDDWQEVDDNDDTYYRVTDAPLVDGNVEIDLMKKLWKNSAPTASFSAQDITLASDDYDLYSVIYTISSANALVLPTPLIPKGNGTQLVRGLNASMFRNITYVSDTSLSVSAGTNNSSTDNTILIPVAIYGIKQKVTISLSAIISSVKATVDYSTDEHVIGTWIDGSTLYEKTISNISLPNASSTQVPHNISNLSKIIEIKGCFTNDAHTSYNPLPYIDIDGIQYCIRLNVYSSVIQIITGSDFSAYKADVTLRYTKTS